jgi:hypothetical protein
MWWHVHAGTGAQVVRTVVVDEAPRADQGTFALRERPSHPDCPWPTQRNLARMQHTGEW